MPVDDSKIDDINSQLQDFQNNLRVEIENISMVMRNLSKVRSRVVSYDVDEKTGAKIPKLDKPLDYDMGNVPMEDTKRQTIFDTNLSMAKKILGIK